MNATAPNPSTAFGHHQPSRPLRWLEPIQEPVRDTCTRRGGERLPWYLADAREQRGEYCTA